MCFVWSKWSLDLGLTEDDMYLYWANKLCSACWCNPAGMSWRPKIDREWNSHGAESARPRGSPSLQTICNYLYLFMYLYLQLPKRRTFRMLLEPQCTGSITHSPLPLCPLESNFLVVSILLRLSLIKSCPWKIYPNSFQFRLWFCSLSTFFWETLYLYLHLKFPWGRDLGSGGAQVCKLLATISICKCTYNYLYLYFKIPRGRACSHKGEPKSAKLSVHTDNDYHSGLTVCALFTNLFLNIKMHQEMLSKK